MEMNPLSDTCFVNIFSYPVADGFHSVDCSLSVQKRFTLLEFHSTSFAFVTCAFGLISKMMVQQIWKTVRKFLEKLKIQQPYDPAILLLGLSLRESQSGS